MFAFGVSTQALLYANQKLNAELLKNVFFPAYFVIAGEYYTRTSIMDADFCDPNTTDRCPDRVGAKVILPIYIVYMIFLNILLIPLLIAIFNKTNSKIQDRYDQLSKYQRFYLVYKYFHHPILPPPFILFYYIYFLIKLAGRGLIRLLRLKRNPPNIIKRVLFYFATNYESGLYYELESLEKLEEIMNWENFIADEVHQKEKDTQKESSDFKMNQNFIKLESLRNKCEYILRDELASLLDDSEAKLESLIGPFKSNKANIKPLINKSVKNLQEKKEIKADETDTVKTPIKEILKEQEKDELAEIFQAITSVRRPNWSEPRDDYNPLFYTSNLIKNNPKADIDLLDYSPSIRTLFKFNEIDDQIDRRSIVKYSVENNLPLNPMGRMGVTGRSEYRYWGPNHAILPIFSRWQNGDSHRKSLEVLMENKNGVYSLPKIFNKQTHFNDNTFALKLIARIFSTEIEKNNILKEKIKILIMNSKKIHQFISNNYQDTDNAWIEYHLFNYHDKDNDMFFEISLQSTKSHTESKLEWKLMDETFLNSLDLVNSQCLKAIFKIQGAYSNNINGL